MENRPSGTPLIRGDREAREAAHAKAGDWLDQGYGSCLLRSPDHQKIVGDALRHFDHEEIRGRADARYEVNAFVVMPNHVHLIVRPFDTAGHTLEKILQCWERFTAREINKARGKEGSIWFEESFDRLIRDGTHLLRCLHYIGRNPGKAGLTLEQCPRWICSQWLEFGWDFRT